MDRQEIELLSFYEKRLGQICREAQQSLLAATEALDRLQSSMADTCGGGVGQRLRRRVAVTRGGLEEADYALGTALGVALSPPSGGGADTPESG